MEGSYKFLQSYTFDGINGIDSIHLSLNLPRETARLLRNKSIFEDLARLNTLIYSYCSPLSCGEKT